MPSKTIHETTRNVFSCPFRVILWIVLARGKTNPKEFRALPPDRVSTKIGPPMKLEPWLRPGDHFVPFHHIRGRQPTRRILSVFFGVKAVPPSVCIFSIIGMQNFVLT